MDYIPKNLVEFVNKHGRLEVNYETSTLDLSIRINEEEISELKRLGLSISCISHLKKCVKTISKRRKALKYGIR